MNLTITQEYHILIGVFVFLLGLFAVCSCIAFVNLASEALGLRN